jgi:hypothetical protein
MLAQQALLGFDRYRKFGSVGLELIALPNDLVELDLPFAKYLLELTNALLSPDMPADADADCDSDNSTYSKLNDKTAHRLSCWPTVLTGAIIDPALEGRGSRCVSHGIRSNLPTSRSMAERHAAKHD